MGSKRLERIQAAIERLTDAKTTGLEAEVAAAWDALGARLPGNVKQEDTLPARQAQTERAAELMATQEHFERSAKNVAAGFSSVRDGLEALGISDDQADATVDEALGIAAQAGQFILDPKTGTVIQGRQVGQLTEAMVRLAGVLQPGEEINPAAIAERLKVKPSSASHLLKRTRGVSGDNLVEAAGRGRYRRNPDLVVLGEKLVVQAGILKEVIPPTAQTADEEQRFWGAQVVADLEHVGIGALNTLQAAGIFKKGQHFETTVSGRRVYRPAAKEIARRLDEAAAAAPIGRITREFVLKTFGRPREVKSTDQPVWENPYGPNGPAAANNDLVEYVLASAINDCLRPTTSDEQGRSPLEMKTGRQATTNTLALAGEVAMRLVQLGGRLGLGEKNGAETLYPEEIKSLELPEGGKAAAYRIAAATLLELASDARPFNFLQKERPTYAYLLAVVRGLREIEPGLIETMARNLVSPQPLVGEGTWVDGVKTLNHRSPLD